MKIHISRQHKRLKECQQTPKYDDRHQQTTERHQDTDAHSQTTPYFLLQGNPNCIFLYCCSFLGFSSEALDGKLGIYWNLPFVDFVLQQIHSAPFFLVCVGIHNKSLLRSSWERRWNPTGCWKQLWLGAENNFGWLLKTTLVGRWEQLWLAAENNFG